MNYADADHGRYGPNRNRQRKWKPVGYPSLVSGRKEGRREDRLRDVRGRAALSAQPAFSVPEPTLEPPPGWRRWKSAEGLCRRSSRSASYENRFVPEVVESQLQGHLDTDWRPLVRWARKTGAGLPDHACNPEQDRSDRRLHKRSPRALGQGNGGYARRAERRPLAPDDHDHDRLEDAGDGQRERSDQGCLISARQIGLSEPQSFRNPLGAEKDRRGDSRLSRMTTARGEGPSAHADRKSARYQAGP